MFQIEVAGLVIRIDNRYEDVRVLCKDYIIGDERKADLCIAVSEEELRREMGKAPELFFEDGYGEEVVIYEKISNVLPVFNAFVMHSSVVEVGGWAYAFAAESGTGKTTHTRYWKEVLGDRVTVINGDKPICRFVSGNRLRAGRSLHFGRDDNEDRQQVGRSLDYARDDNKEELYAFGTPWCGKEGWQTKTSAPLKALCLLERAEKNEIYPIDAFENLVELMGHFHLPGDGQVDMVKLMELIDRMISIIPVYRLRCRNDISAAETAIQYFRLKGE